MTLQDNQPLTVPRRPLKDDNEAWQAYSEQWIIYCNQHKDQHKHLEDLEGWQEYHDNWCEYWEKQRQQPWRTEPLIERERQHQLDEWRQSIESEEQKNLWRSEIDTCRY